MSNCQLSTVHCQLRNRLLYGYNVIVYGLTAVYKHNFGISEFCIYLFVQFLSFIFGNVRTVYQSDKGSSSV